MRGGEGAVRGRNSSQTASFDEGALAVVRRAFARQLVCGAGAQNDVRLQRAFAETPREAFLGGGPWLLTRGVGYEAAPADPVLAYQDRLIALKPEKQINNGSPSLHAVWLHAAEIKAGERVTHIGAGAGYYTAVLSRLVGARGRVTAVEFDEDLATTARKNLSGYPNVKVVHGDGAIWPREPCDVVYVNFAVDRPAPPWIEQLKSGGRLLFPLGSIARETNRSSFYGVGLRIERVGGASIFAAKYGGNAYFVRAEGGASVLVASGAERDALLAAFEKGGVERVNSLRWRVPASPDRAWFVGDGWSLEYDGL
jgi:protein-L-isoaspartate(D-aspartate) O-methyltransferase